MTRKSRWSGSVAWVLALALGIPCARMALGEAPSDRSVAEQILATVAGAASGPSPATSGSSSPASIAKRPVDEARRALERAAGARHSGDVHHAELLEGLAREWAETARDLVRAAATEADAGTLEIAAADAGLRAERARALLEESIARRGRAEAELEKLTADAGAFPPKPPPATSAHPKTPRGPR